MARIPYDSLSAADQQRSRGLRTMKAVALGALVFMAIVFVIAFILEKDISGWGYVRAAAEGGMVGALADWFAVTALFRHPLGIKIPHTAIIPRRKDEIGRTLGEFVETNFLEGGVVRQKLESTNIARTAGTWLQDPAHAKTVAAEASTMATGILTALSDDEVQDLISDLAHEHLLSPSWGPSLGTWLSRVVDADAHRGAVDLGVDSIARWLDANREAFDGLVSRRLPSWVPSVAMRLVDDTVYHEATKFVAAVQRDPDHPARKALDQYLERLADNLQHDPETIGRLEGAKSAVFDSPRVRALAADAWNTAKAGLLRSLADEDSPLRRRVTAALGDLGDRLASDTALQQRVDKRIADAAVFLVDRYRHDIASIITDTVERWDADETSQKIELQVGRDLQYIRLNGTIVGALAGLAIFTVAHLLLP
ncbi:DUF445 domain-containing protein [Microbacterium sp. EYE_5]|uniref:DUF445 domain-containing protein n=1 Tax=unclassified Microbacterium TaxID=2609290 RepID=UPI00200378A9|nr:MULTISPECIES: DUF445 domain-containing protein [unclassified Microbacterium]MCK6081204.1 DUF445 domain-containing protein [Microbacterium sp. EYE_382]MCK6086474.1 DUF445 domain-containing protein [Microbacterium sp. EYE_384]MCK6124028.1 DUF445 domain-containing protein [Microbacterium sp. EYE_80]MCK6126937.1 DUF445 domain-containing protein [Microbacterium sp. EYE_79]MCK6142159.1 DUF445 domain-containing protein [Microbacterium sp. EYE_39]